MCNRLRTIAVNFDIVTKLTSLGLDLDAIVQEFLKRSTVEETIARRARVVNDKLVLRSRNFGGSGFGLHILRYTVERRKARD